MLQAM